MRPFIFWTVVVPILRWRNYTTALSAAPALQRYYFYVVAYLAAAQPYQHYSYLFSLRDRAAVGRIFRTMYPAVGKAAEEIVREGEAARRRRK